MHCVMQLDAVLSLWSPEIVTARKTNVAHVPVWTWRYTLPRPSLRRYTEYEPLVQGGEGDGGGEGGMFGDTLQTQATHSHSHTHAVHPSTYRAAAARQIAGLSQRHAGRGGAGWEIHRLAGEEGRGPNPLTQNAPRQQMEEGQPDRRPRPRWTPHLQENVTGNFKMRRSARRPHKELSSTQRRRQGTNGEVNLLPAATKLQCWERLG